MVLGKVDDTFHPMRALASCRISGTTIVDFIGPDEAQRDQGWKAQAGCRDEDRAF